MTSYRKGRNAAAVPPAVKDLAVYAYGPLPTPPATVVVPAGAPYPIDGNASYGCCTIDGVVHLMEAWAAKYGLQLKPIVEADVITEYLKLTGGQDSGLNEAQVLTCWQQAGLFGDKIAAWAPVDVNNLLGLHQSIAFYDGVYLGTKCPRSAQVQFANHEPWTYQGEETQAGHCIVGLGYDEVGDLLCATWGGITKVTASFRAHYFEEAYCLISSELVSRKSDGLGLDLQALVADLALV